MAEGIAADWITKIAAWAAVEPLVLEVYVFGSRARGDHRTESDLDLALLIEDGDCGESLAHWTCEAERWREALTAALPVTVDLQVMQTDDGVVMPAVQREGMLIYRAART
ncbi:nucleotidyltransferase domain-containing protein [Sphingomonas sp. LB-2]|uniref:nucleotidyltransferase family protein n=1 Tax=Sphingomonas caeni TaxID=2984949 RepID=UPI002230A1A9|nr:nucleotidyltransferase domain-containing protein [Sphingomonas caeni]MCW3848529.1 nucleotidyltransferase domain-containing protein [Sphingomonas caeni]